MLQSNNDILRSRQVDALRGTIYVPGDKSIHIDRLFGRFSNWRNPHYWLVEGADVMATKNALIALGVEIEKIENGDWQLVLV